MDYEEALRHAGPLNRTPEIVLAEIRENMPHYLWIDDHYEQTWFDGFFEPDPREKARRIHCDVCGEERVESRRGGKWAETYQQNRRGACPMCGAQVIAKHIGRGFGTLRDVLDVVYFDKSWLNPDAVVVYAAHCVRDYGWADAREPWTLDTEVDVRGIAVAICGQGAWKFNRHVTDWCIDGRPVPVDFEWRESKRLNNMAFQSTFYAAQVERVVAINSLHDAIEDTPFARAWDESYLQLYNMQDGLLALAMIARYPCIEYMTKLGWTDFLQRRLSGSLPQNLINWNGRTMAQVLRLKKSRLGELKGQKIGVSVELVAVLQWADKLGIRCGARLAAALANACRGDGKDIKARLTGTVGLLPAGKRDKALKYIANIGNRGEIDDYWRAEAAIGGNLGDDAVAFPANFRQAHDRTVRRRKYAANSIHDGQIKKRLEKLDAKYGFRFGGLILRPAASSAEVIREGEALSHCVGGYVQSYAEGRTNIFVLRRAVEPDTPWRTVEIANDGHVVQDRGYHNDWGSGSLMTEHYRAALDLFWQAWKERKIA